ncbi:MAG: hypothetical protein LBS60_02675 [Deltaproteobacteria bacterium]|jgi:hypothetical protein|nr:hypothetical protein [Deltaproteobacteria bacterium]
MSEYYKPSGNYRISSIITLFIVTAVVSIPLGIIYSLALWYSPIIYLSILGPWVYGVAVAAIAGRIIKSQAIRSPGVAGLTGVLGILPGYYFSWLTWANLLVNTSGTIDFGSKKGGIHLAKSMIDLKEIFQTIPYYQDLWELIKAVNVEGLWSLGRIKQSVNGPFLWGVWAAELLVLLGTIALHYRGKAQQPYSEELSAWIPKIVLGQKLTLPADENFGQRLQEGDISFLFQGSTLEDLNSDSYLDLTVYYAPEISNAYLDVKIKTLTKKKSHKSDDLVNFMQIGHNDAKNLVDRFA